MAFNPYSFYYCADVPGLTNAVQRFLRINCPIFRSRSGRGIFLVVDPGRPIPGLVKLDVRWSAARTALGDDTLWAQLFPRGDMDEVVFGHEDSRTL